MTQVCVTDDKTWVPEVIFVLLVRITEGITTKSEVSCVTPLARRTSHPIQAIFRNLQKSSAVYPFPGNLPWEIIWGSPCGIHRRFLEINTISFLIFGSSHESRSGLATSFASLVARKSSQSAALVARTSCISAIIVSTMAIIPTAN